MADLQTAEPVSQMPVETIKTVHGGNSHLRLFTFMRMQRGWWGQSHVADVKVKAKSLEEAWRIIRARKDFGKRLRNGDHYGYDFYKEEELSK